MRQFCMFITLISLVSLSSTLLFVISTEVSNWNFENGVEIKVASAYENNNYSAGNSTKFSDNMTSDTNLKLNPNCGGDIDVDPSSTSFNETEIKCVEDALKKCTNSDLNLIYQMGSLNIRIIGPIEDKCRLGIAYEIERGESLYNCSIPLSTMENWNSWKDKTGLDALSDILPYCKQLAPRSF